jgi:hypothetical protein
LVPQELMLELLQIIKQAEQRQLSLLQKLKKVETTAATSQLLKKL